MSLLAALVLQQAQVRVVDFDAAGRVALEDGRRLELAGVAWLDPGPRPAFEGAWRGAWSLELVSVDPARPAEAWLERGDESLAGELVRRGLVRPDPAGLAGKRARQLGRAAAEGIRGRAGYRALWPPASPLPGGLRAGVALPLHHLGDWEDYERQLAEVRDLGAGWIHLIVHGHQLAAGSTEILWERERTPREARIVRTIRRARELGLEVLLSPVVLLLQPGPGDWRGALRPEQPRRWWLEYERFLLRMADLAAEGGARALSIGSELASLEAARGRWERLASDVRMRFPGQLTYSANWDHFATIGFWDALDFASVSAYFELADTDDPTPRELVRGWSAALEEVRLLARSAGSPIVLTEVGLPSQRGAARTPWDYTLRRPVDLELQAQAFRAFGRVCLGPQRPAAIGGFFLYDWWGEGGASDDSYTARGKPAEAVWRELLSEARRKAGVVR